MSASNSVEHAAGTVITDGAMPVRPASRTWGRMALFGSTASAAIATWCFIGGGFAAYYLPAASGALAITAGTLLGVFFVVLAAVPASTRYGIEAVRSTRPTLGARGSMITLVIVLAIMVGWNSILIIFLGNAAGEALVAMGVLSSDVQGVASVVFSLVGLAIVLLLLRRGPNAVRDIAPVIATGIIILSVAIGVMLVATVGIDQLFALPPLGAYDSQALNFATVLELGIAGGLAWWPYIGSLTRYARSTGATITPVVLGLGVLMSFVLVIGLLAALAVPESGGNPTLFLVEIGGPVFGIVALAFIVFANVGTTLVGVYVCALALKQVPAVDRRLGWKTTTLLVAIPVAVVTVFFADVFIDYYGNFLAFIGVLLGPVCGIQIADYYVIRRQNLSIRDLYSQSTGGRYWYVAGVNPVGIVALIAGIIAYIALLDPISYVANPGFEFMTASIPAVLVAGVVYLALMRLIPNYWPRAVVAQSTEAAR